MVGMIPGGLAQLARAPALHAGGHRFESDILHTKKNVRLRCGALFSLTVINVISAVKIYHEQGHNNANLNSVYRLRSSIGRAADL